MCQMRAGRSRWTRKPAKSQPAILPPRGLRSKGRAVTLRLRYLLLLLFSQRGQIALMIESAIPTVFFHCLGICWDTMKTTFGVERPVLGYFLCPASFASVTL